jgi:hypothetical protein
MASFVTVSAELVERVRSNINEPASNNDPLRGDLEIAQWLQDGLLDYIAKIPADAVPELVVHKTFTGSYWSITDDYLRLLHVVIDHVLTIGSTSMTLTEQAYVLDVDEQNLVLYQPAIMGAWARFDRDDTGEHVIRAGPNCVSGTITYLGIPASIAHCNSIFPLGQEHEEPIVNYATNQALGKVNDEDAPRYMERYKERVAAESARYTRPWKTEKESSDGKS